jgi:hypothetical protein
MLSIRPMMLLVLALLAVALPGTTAAEGACGRTELYHDGCPAFTKETSCWGTVRELCGDSDSPALGCLAIGLASVGETDQEKVLNEKWCLADDFADCCEANVGMIVGVSVGVLVFLGTYASRA